MVGVLRLKQVPLFLMVILLCGCHAPTDRVWEREFPDSISSVDIQFCVTEDNELLVFQNEYTEYKEEAIPSFITPHSRLDLKKRETEDALFFFSGKLLKDYKNANLKLDECFDIYTEKRVQLASKKVIAVEPSGSYDFWASDPRPAQSLKTYKAGAIDSFRAFDEKGDVLFEKVYLYFDPHKDYLFSDEFIWRAFFYFKSGRVVLIDDGLSFVFFHGSNKIFRLDNNGKVITKDKNLIVLELSDYLQYKNKYSLHEPSEGSCKLETEKYKIPIAPYDKVGELLAKQYSLDFKSINKVLKNEPALRECYSRFIDFKKG